MSGRVDGGDWRLSRRDWMARSAFIPLAGAFASWHALGSQRPVPSAKAQIAITLDLEMSRNFPNWENTHWDYDKGNLDQATRRYAREAGRRVHARGGRIHYFCVGRVLEQPDVEWLKELASEGHALGNHTYDHVYLLASDPSQLQFRFQRAPWLVEGRAIQDVLRENIRLTTQALRARIGVDNVGFRAPGGFAQGLEGREDLQRMLLDLGFKWVSSRYPAHANTKPMERPTEEIFQSIVQAQADAQPRAYPTGLIEIPMSPISDIGAFRTGRWKLEWFLEAVRRSVQHTIQQGLVFDFLAHPSCLGVVDPEFRTIDMICDLVEQSKDRAELVDLDRIAGGL